MTLEEAYQLLLYDLDRAYKELKDIHSKPEYLNDESEGFVIAKSNFNLCQNRLFLFKDIWVIIKRVEQRKMED